MFPSHRAKTPTLTLPRDYAGEGTILCPYPGSPRASENPSSASPGTPGGGLGWGPMGQPTLNLPQNHLRHRIRVFQRIIIRKTNHVDSLRRHRRRAMRVISDRLGVVVLPAVEFHH